MPRTFKHPALAAFLKSKGACPEQAEKAIAFASGFRTLAAAARTAAKQASPTDICDDNHYRLDWLAYSAGSRAYMRVCENTRHGDDARHAKLHALAIRKAQQLDARETKTRAAARVAKARRLARAKAR